LAETAATKRVSGSGGGARRIEEARLRVAAAERNLKYVKGEQA